VRTVLERIEGPDAVLVLRAVGKVEKSDYESVLEPAAEAMIADRGEVRFVYVLGDDFEGYSVAAGWEDTKFGIGHLSKWKRIAVVTDHEWLRHAVGMFRWMVPGDVKVFPMAEQSAAIDWAAA
jgi:SpoIIAA-like